VLQESLLFTCTFATVARSPAPWSGWFRSGTRVFHNRPLYRHEAERSQAEGPGVEEGMQTRALRSMGVLLVSVALGIGVAAQGGQPQGGGQGQPGAAAPGAPGQGAPGRGRGGRGGGRGGLAPLLMQTDAFPDGGIVPQKYAGRGGIQPGFTFSNAPEGTVSFAIIFHDLDVALNNGTDDVLHWMVWNIPASAGGIPEGKLPPGSVQGRNLMGQASYFGPGAPAGPRYHHYVFELYALNANLELPETASRADLLQAMQGKVIGKSAYVGRFRTEPQ
jgi:Raf kinase inhibitor-like YbhB/YbcL family protein